MAAGGANHIRPPHCATIAGAPSQTAITCPACGASARFHIGSVRSCGGTFCQHCAELILLDGEFVAASCEAIDNAMRELDDLLGELRKPRAPSIAGKLFG